MKTRRRHSRRAAPRDPPLGNQAVADEQAVGGVVKRLAPSGRVDLGHGGNHIRPRRDHLGDREPELCAPEVHGRHPPQIPLRVGPVNATVPVGDERAQVTGEEPAHSLHRLACEGRSGWLALLPGVVADLSHWSVFCSTGEGLAGRSGS